MKTPPIDIAVSLARLSALTIFELRGEWRRHHRMSPPMRLSRDLLIRGITYKLQERALRRPVEGQPSQARQGKRRGLSRDARPFSAADHVKAGHAARQRVARCHAHGTRALADGVEWRGQRYGSLTEVAREITGARWSGPRFFGIRRPPAASRTRARKAMPGVSALRAGPCPLRDLHAQVLRRGARAGVQLARCAARGLCGLHPEPAARGLDRAARDVRRRRLLGRHHGAAGAPAAARRHQGRQGRRRRGLQGRPADALARRLRQDRRDPRRARGVSSSR